MQGPRGQGEVPAFRQGQGITNQAKIEIHSKSVSVNYNRFMKRIGHHG
jgi:hypothetical protein